MSNDRREVYNEEGKNTETQFNSFQMEVIFVKVTNFFNPKKSIGNYLFYLKS